MISREIACVDPLIGPVWTFYEGVKLESLVKSPDCARQRIDTVDPA